MVEFYVELGPYRDTPEHMETFIDMYMRRAIQVGCQVRGPYKVRHHRGGWIKVFEFTSRRKTDVEKIDPSLRAQRRVV